jgi:hypothetical protein
VGPHQVPGLDRSRDALALLEGVVDAQEGGIGTALLGGGEHHAALERGGVPHVEVAVLAQVDQREQDLAARLVEGGPGLAGADRGVEGVVVAPDVVGGDDPVLVEHREDLGLEVVEQLPRHRQHLGERDAHRLDVDPTLGRQVSQRHRLGLDHDHERQVVGLAARPRLDLAEARRQGPARGLEVDVGGVHHLEPGLVELGHTRLGRLADHLERRSVREAAAVRVGVHVDLELADAVLGELLGERAVLVVDLLGERGVDRGNPGQHLRSGPQLVAVVRPQRLQVVEPDLAVGAGTGLVGGLLAGCGALGGGTGAIVVVPARGHQHGERSDEEHGDRAAGRGHDRRP